MLISSSSSLNSSSSFDQSRGTIMLCAFKTSPKTYTIPVFTSSQVQKGQKICVLVITCECILLWFYANFYITGYTLVPILFARIRVFILPSTWIQEKSRLVSKILLFKSLPHHHQWHHDQSSVDSMTAAFTVVCKKLDPLFFLNNSLNRSI